MRNFFFLNLSRYTLIVKIVYIYDTKKEQPRRLRYSGRARAPPLIEAYLLKKRKTKCSLLGIVFVANSTKKKEREEKHVFFCYNLLL